MSATQPTLAGFRSETTVVGGLRLHSWTGGDPNAPPVLLWHGFLGTGYTWHKVAPKLVAAGLSVLVPDMRGYGDSDKPPGTEGYDARALAEEMRGVVRALAFGRGKPLTVVAHDMGAPPALIWAADHAAEVASLLYIEAPVMLSSILQKVLAFTPDAMKEGSMWWWILPLAPGVPERLIVGRERSFLEWFYDGVTMRRESIEPETIDEYLRYVRGPDRRAGCPWRLQSGVREHRADGAAHEAEGPRSRRRYRRGQGTRREGTRHGAPGRRERGSRNALRLRALRPRRAPRRSGPGRTQDSCPDEPLNEENGT
jgi:pimeloyl-ACP methyl ester carboxylesterase